MIAQGLTTKDTNDTKGGDVLGHGMTRKITEVGRTVGARRMTTKDTKYTKLGSGVWGHGMTRKITEMGRG
jgi:hypothetical protein